MTNVEDTVTIHGKRIASLEGDVNTLKVDTSKLALKLDHQEERQQERFNTLCTSQIELKDIMKARMEADEKRAEESRKYRAEREKQEADANLQKQKWMQSLLTPQTMVIILVILAGLFGVKGLDMMDATKLVADPGAPPTGTVP
jgi:septal ring factor EnvC (AmiA/AmiB activator)